MAIRNTLVPASSSHTRTKATGSSQLSQAFVAFFSKKNKTSHTCFLSFCSPVRSLSVSLCPTPIPLIDLEKVTKADRISISVKKGRGKKDNTHRLTQYMQSEAVLFDDKAFTHGKRGTDTEIGRTLQPMRRFLPGIWERVGELQKRFS